jgi:transposase
LEKDKPPILGLIQRGGQIVLHMLPNVQQATIKPIISDTVAPGTLIHTDEYDIYARLPAWGYGHKTVCHARDEDGDGFAKSTSTPLRASGRCCGHGCVRTGVSRRTSCRCISASSSSCTTLVSAAKPCLAPWWRRLWDETIHHPETQ